MEDAMISKYVAAAALVSAALITTAAFAQTSPASPNSATTASMSHHEWRASKVIGINVYNDANEKIGDINELLLDRSGKIANVIIGVGGFLGVGEHNVAIEYNKIKWLDQPVASTASTTKTTTTTTGTASTSSHRPTTGIRITSSSTQRKSN
jgi:sporulation protein YlmC with PRC-barrel domain